MDVRFSDKPIITESIRKTTVKRVELAGDAVIKLLMDAYPELFLSKGTRATVHVRVPGGGDWSNTDLPIDEVYKIVVTITAEESSDGTPRQA